MNPKTHTGTHSFSMVHQSNMMVILDRVCYSFFLHCASQKRHDRPTSHRRDTWVWVRRLGECKGIYLIQCGSSHPAKEARCLSGLIVRVCLFDAFIHSFIAHLDKRDTIDQESKAIHYGRSKLNESSFVESR
jgi:hypothetical protein